MTAIDNLPSCHWIYRITC